MTESRWASSAGRQRGLDYATRFERLAASGADVHGEAAFCASLVPPGARVLDAGCGTGRVAIRLAELGYHCVGIDSDASMLEVAHATSTDVTWRLGDLAELGELGAIGEPFDLVVAAGNVIPFLGPGTEATVIAGLAARLKPDGLLVAGFGLDATHLPLAAAAFGLDEYDAWCVSAGLQPVARFATWARDPYDDGGYAVNVHRRVPPPG